MEDDTYLVLKNLFNIYDACVNIMCEYINLSAKRNTFVNVVQKRYEKNHIRIVFV